MSKNNSLQKANIFKLIQHNDIAKKIPIIKDIPSFNSVPEQITSSNYRFYKLSNLVLTLGMFVHFSWVFLFYFWHAAIMAQVNIVSFLIYISAIIINRKGYHFTSSVIMVLEIIIHQIIAVHYFGLNGGFQNYVLVIGLFPALMPKGKWFVKSVLILFCVVTFLLFDWFAKGTVPVYMLSDWQLAILRYSNIVFSFVSLVISGGYFNLAMHETEELLQKKTIELQIEKEKSEDLLLNILPVEVALELKNNKFSKPRKFDMVTVLFADFINFTQATERLTPEELVDEIHYCYSEFDKIVSYHGVEKIKTIGDAYMCAGGIPKVSSQHAIQILNAAFDIMHFMNAEKQKKAKLGKSFFEIRIGVHSGSVVAGIVGLKKFAYDIWGDTVNTASRLETNSQPNKINISGTTYQLIKNNFECTYRGKIHAKGKGEIDMYFVENRL